jgi:threonine/homoserine/homoserine lactone efflux protein
MSAAGAIGQILPLAVGVAVSPMPIAACVLLLATPRARVIGPAFLLGWIAGIAIVGTIVMLVAGPSDASDAGGPATWVNWLKLVLGVLLLLVAVRQWRSQPKGDAPAEAPKWMGALEKLTPVKALAAAFVLAGVNPKNLLIIIAAGVAVAQTGIPSGDQAIAWIVFTIIAAIGVAAPVVIYFALGDRAKAILDGLKVWLIRHNTAVLAVLFLIIGFKLIGDAITGFAA